MLMRPTSLEIKTSSDSTTLAVASTATVYTKSFPLPYGGSFGVSAKAASSGTINVKVELEESYRLPINEGSADDYWVVPTGISDVFTSVANSTQLHKALSPIVMRYGRFKLTGVASNDASTTLTMFLHYQEEI